MKRVFRWLAPLVFASLIAAQPVPHSDRHDRRLLILKVDGLGADRLYDAMREIDPTTGKSRLPWMSYVFAEHGTIFDNFYTRGISLSAPSWSMLDTGRHGIIRGNVEFDRYTGHTYDYLNFVPFYLGYARKLRVDMPGVEVLDRAGIPLVSDRFPLRQVFQAPQLFQRGVDWTSLSHALERHFSGKAVMSMIEGSGSPSMDETLLAQEVADVKTAIAEPEIFYIDYYTGEIDHVGHANNDPAALMAQLKHLDALVGRLWAAIQSSPLAQDTTVVMVSDHGMNNVPGIASQGFSLSDFFGSPQGGAHHVITDRHQLSDYKLAGLNPLVSRVPMESKASFYLKGETNRYPTAWLDVDGNERASVWLRNSDLNKIHILLLQLARTDLAPEIRRAAAECLDETIDRHRAAWTATANELDQEMRALAQRIDERKAEGLKRTRTGHQADRLLDELDDWQREEREYTSYLTHLRGLLAFRADPANPFKQKISDLVPELVLGDLNTVGQLQHYIAGPAENGLVLDTAGHLDEDRSFRHVDYFSMLAAQRVHNNPQPTVSPRPIDFMAMALANGDYWLYGDEDKQLIIHVGPDGRISVQPVQNLKEEDGHLQFQKQPWCAGLPLHIFEDPALHLPPGADRAAWLSEPHTEREWMDAIHKTEYSNGVISITEYFSPVGTNVPGPPGISPILLRYERRRRELVQPDFEVFAADHWNFNVRDFNPGGNHGSFLRISTHSVWMMEGRGVPVHTVIQEPYDTLNFASTILSVAGRTPPMPDRVVLQ
ncbi:MAG TPA: alkaline phosphatase family protein [Bryobacteraceae bacterium]|nr:alkaline phosphatase family protein [Bryobacteraceae bacterium]